jgi:hypothetical protein
LSQNNYLCWRWFDSRFLFRRWWVHLVWKISETSCAELWSAQIDAEYWTVDRWSTVNWCRIVYFLEEQPWFHIQDCGFVFFELTEATHPVCWFLFHYLAFKFYIQFWVVHISMCCFVGNHSWSEFIKTFFGLIMFEKAMCMDTLCWQ